MRPTTVELACYQIVCGTPGGDQKWFTVAAGSVGRAMEMADALETALPVHTAGRSNGLDVVRVDVWSGLNALRVNGVIVRLESWAVTQDRRVTVYLVSSLARLVDVLGDVTDVVEIARKHAPPVDAVSLFGVIDALPPAREGH